MSGNAHPDALVAARVGVAAARNAVQALLCTPRDADGRPQLTVQQARALHRTISDAAAELTAAFATAAALLAER